MTRADKTMDFALKLAQELDKGEFPDDLEPLALAYMLRTLVSRMQKFQSAVNQLDPH